MVSTKIFSLFYEEKLQISSYKIIASKRLRVQCWGSQLLHPKLFECIYVKYSKSSDILYISLELLDIFNLIINLSQIIGSKSCYSRTKPKTKRNEKQKRIKYMELPNLGLMQCCV